MRIRDALLVTAVAAVGLVGCSSAPSKVGIEGRPPNDTGNITASSKVAGLLIPKPTGPADHFGDGMFEVVTDVKPGEYKTAGPPAGLDPPARCYWARLSGTGGQLADIIASGYGNTGPDMVTISPSDKAFESRGCGVWQLAGKS